MRTFGSFNIEEVYDAIKDDIFAILQKSKEIIQRYV